MNYTQGRIKTIRGPWALPLEGPFQGSTIRTARLPEASVNDARDSRRNGHLPDRASAVGCALYVVYDIVIVDLTI